MTGPKDDQWHGETRRELEPVKRRSTAEVAMSDSVGVQHKQVLTTPVHDGSA